MNQERSSHWSIGEVLTLLQEEFPDITISKIRFLEGQGLIAPERTPSGYRRFYPGDLEQLRWILIQQRDNYLPLRVIRDQIQSGEVTFSKHPTEPELIQPSLGFTESSQTGSIPDEAEAEQAGSAARAENTMAAPESASSSTQGAKNAESDGNAESDRKSKETKTKKTTKSEASTSPAALSRSELAVQSGCSTTMLNELERHGFLGGNSNGSTTLYGPDDLQLVKLAKKFAEHGLEPRHLRTFRLAAEREVGMFAQIVGPQLRRQDAKTNAKSYALLDELTSMASTMHEVIVRKTIRSQLPNPEST